MGTSEKIFAGLSDAFISCVRSNKEDEGTLIGLPNPYVVPSLVERFKSMYYWDTYFTNIGLIELGLTELAKSNTDNILWLVEKYGFMPNGSRTIFLNRSQPPFSSLMVRDVFKATGDREWLLGAYQTLTKEYAFWQNKKIFPCGLNGYTGFDEIAPENMIAEYDYYVRRLKKEAQGAENLQPDYPLNPEDTDAEARKNICLAHLSFCESGWDCNSRFLDCGYDFLAVDLCSLLYDFEKNMRDFSGILKLGEEELWQKRMDERREKMKALWSEKDNLFLDKNAVTGEFSTYRSLASVYPMFAGLATEKEAEKTVEFIESIELEYGFPCGENKTLWHCQWDYPRVWAPLQYILYVALKSYGYDGLADKVARKYMSLVEKNYRETGMLWEQYSGDDGSIPEKAVKMYGWTAGVYAYFYKLKSKSHTITVAECGGKNEKI